MRRIYFDANEGDEAGRFDLGILGAVRDIDPVASELTEGMRVILYDNEELEVEAVPEFHLASGRWMGSATLSHLEAIP